MIKTNIITKLYIAIRQKNILFYLPTKYTHYGELCEICAIIINKI